MRSRRRWLARTYLCRRRSRRRWLALDPSVSPPSSASSARPPPARPLSVLFVFFWVSLLLSQSAALLLLRSWADGLSLNVTTRSRMMLWRKTVVAAIAGLSCCRRRKWWLRSTCCHCFNGEENKNSRCWVWAERLPRLKTKLLFMLRKPPVVWGAHAGRPMHAHGAWMHGEGVSAAVTGEKRGYCSTGRTVGELVSRGGREKEDCDGAKTQPEERFWFSSLFMKRGQMVKMTVLVSKQRGKEKPRRACSVFLVTWEEEEKKLGGGGSGG